MMLLLRVRHEFAWHLHCFAKWLRPRYERLEGWLRSWYDDIGPGVQL
jgi:hypothetical protein